MEKPSSSIRSLLLRFTAIQISLLLLLKNLVKFKCISLDIVDYHSSAKMAIKKKKSPEKFIDFMFHNFSIGSPQFYGKEKELLQIEEKKITLKIN